MSFRSTMQRLVGILGCCVHHPRLLNQLPHVRRAFQYVRLWGTEVTPESAPAAEPYIDSANPLRTFFESRETGRGIWKWNHYFDVYHRHFAKFIGKAVHVLEIGVYSGGSLEMWKQYFGPRCFIYGVDIEEGCRCYEDESTRIMIGDQGNRDFWKVFKEHVPVLDILIDDGGHRMEQQIVTLEEMLPHLRPGGVYVCEDVHGEHNGFSGYLQGLVHSLNSFDAIGPDRHVDATPFQAWTHSIHFYPFATVIEKSDQPVHRFTNPRRGTEWQPFL